jgi:glutamate--cysteine ligase
LLYDESALDAAYDLVKDWTAEERQNLRNEVPRLALKTPFRKGTVLDVARAALELAAAGLKARGHADLLRGDERVFLEPLVETVSRGKTAAEHLLDSYHGAWGGDVRPVFTENAY